jgi:hypothetical protein
MPRHRQASARGRPPTYGWGAALNCRAAALEDGRALVVEAVIGENGEPDPA